MAVYPRSPRASVVRGATVPLLAVSWSLAFSGPLAAQESPFPYELGRRDIALASVGAISAVVGIALHNEVAPLTAEEVGALDRGTVNAFDRGATWNWSPDWQNVSDWTRDGLVVAAGAVTFVPVLLDGRWSEAATLGVIFAETAAFTIGVTNLAKVATRRERPYLYNDALSVEERIAEAGDTGEGSLSFFSGHASLSFAAATLLSTTYSDMHGPGTWSTVVWASSLGAATLVSVARVEAGKHFPTDVLVGAVVGGAIGHLVPRLHRRDSPVDVVVTPGYVGVRWSF